MEDAPQRDLIISKYDVLARPLNPFTEIILESENSDWNWFPGGPAYHEQYEMWFIALHTWKMRTDDFDSVVKLAASMMILIYWMSRHWVDQDIPAQVALINNEVVVSYDNGETSYGLKKWSIEPVQ